MIFLLTLTCLCALLSLANLLAATAAGQAGDHQAAHGYQHCAVGQKYRLIHIIQVHISNLSDILQQIVLVDKYLTAWE